jgi:hypothetical protein
VVAVCTFIEDDLCSLYFELELGKFDELLEHRLIATEFDQLAVNVVGVE